MLLESIIGVCVQKFENTVIQNIITNVTIDSKGFLDKKSITFTAKSCIDIYLLKKSRILLHIEEEYSHLYVRN